MLTRQSNNAMPSRGGKKGRDPPTSALERMRRADRKMKGMPEVPLNTSKPVPAKASPKSKEKYQPTLDSIPESISNSESKANHISKSSSNPEAKENPTSKSKVKKSEKAARPQSLNEKYHSLSDEETQPVIPLKSRLKRIHKSKRNDHRLPRQLILHEPRRQPKNEPKEVIALPFKRWPDIIVRGVFRMALEERMKFAWELTPVLVIDQGRLCFTNIRGFPLLQCSKRCYFEAMSLILLECEFQLNFHTEQSIQHILGAMLSNYNPSGISGMSNVKILRKYVTALQIVVYEKEDGRGGDIQFMEQLADDMASVDGKKSSRQKFWGRMLDLLEEVDNYKQLRYLEYAQSKILHNSIYATGFMLALKIKNSIWTMEDGKVSENPPELLISNVEAELSWVEEEERAYIKDKEDAIRRYGKGRSKVSSYDALSKPF